VVVNKFAGSGGFPNEHLAAAERGRVKVVMVGAIGLILRGELLLSSFTV
jgi:hypothetical protein